MFDKVRSAVHFLGDVAEGFRQLSTSPAAEWKRNQALTDKAVTKLEGEVRSAPAGSALASVDGESLYRGGASDSAFVGFRLKGSSSAATRDSAAAIALKAQLHGRDFENIVVGAPPPPPAQPGAFTRAARTSDGFEPAQ